MPTGQWNKSNPIRVIHRVNFPASPILAAPAGKTCVCELLLNAQPTRVSRHNFLLLAKLWRIRWVHPFVVDQRPTFFALKKLLVTSPSVIHLII